VRRTLCTGGVYTCRLGTVRMVCVHLPPGPWSRHTASPALALGLKGGASPNRQMSVSGVGWVAQPVGVGPWSQQFFVLPCLALFV
jgi:hypothetical protein